MTDKIILDKLPNYVKNTEVFGKLKENGVKYIKNDNKIPLYFTGKDFFEKALKIIYFWKIKPPYFYSIYLYMESNPEIVNWLLKYNNEVSTVLLSNPITINYLPTIISKYEHLELFQELIKKNEYTAEELIAKIYPDVSMNFLKKICKKYPKDLNLAFNSAVKFDRFEYITLFVDNGADIHDNKNKALEVAVLNNKKTTIDYLLEKSLSYPISFLFKLNNLTVNNFINNNKERLKITDFMLLCKNSTLDKVKEKIKIEYINELDISGNNSLFYCLFGMNYDIFLYLSDLKISDLNHVNSSNEDVIDLIRKYALNTRANYRNIGNYLYDDDKVPPKPEITYEYSLKRIIFEDNINKFVENVKSYGNDILLVACRYNSTKIANYCIANSIGLNYISEDGTIAFSYVCYFGNEFLFESLLNAQKKSFLLTLDVEKKVPIDYLKNNDLLKLKFFNKTDNDIEYLDDFKIFKPEDFIFMGKDSNKGAYGSVVIGTHKKTGINMAIKKYHTCEDSISEFTVKEIGIQKLINKSYPHVAPKLYGLYFDKGCVHLVQEVLNYTLKKYFEIINDISVDEKNKIIKNVLYELLVNIDSINSIGIAHNDLKNDNIMIDTKNKLKIIDFGISEYFGIYPEKSIIENSTMTSIIQPPDANEYINFRGINYKKPFYCENSIKNLNCDVFSLGVTMFNLVVRPNENMIYIICKDGKFYTYDIYTLISKQQPDEFTDLSLCEPLLLDLFKHMLEYKFDERWFAKDCLKHEYFTGIPYKKQKVDEKIFYYNEIHNLTKNDKLTNVNIIMFDKIESINLNENMLFVLFDWLLEVSIKVKYSLDVFINTCPKIINLITNENIRRSKLQSSGLMMLQINMLFFGYYPMELKDCNYITDNSYSIGELLDMIEFIALNKNNYMTFVPVNTHISYIKIKLEENEILSDRIEFIINEIKSNLIKYVIFNRNVNLEIFELITAIYYNIENVPDLFEKNLDNVKTVHDIFTKSNENIKNKTITRYVKMLEKI